MRYEFRIAGRLSDATAGSFPELHQQSIASQTLLFGPVADGAHLYALLLRFEDLGLRIVEMRRLPEWP
ncbi:hypothetical protein AB0M29_34655 [Streptomyces sp. NPDC051976]|uniref:hypothetical protein n=1 Tax=Streptomyces sp. NPDC051976 TaxID=3154947 RepID=UPI0034329656